MKIVEFINQNGKITNRDVQKMFNIAFKNAYMELLRLLELGVIKSEGKGRSLGYRLK